MRYEKDKVKIDFKVCEHCGYNNHPRRVSFYGTCLRCGKVIDEKTKFIHDMYNKLHLWRGKKWYE